MRNLKRALSLVLASIMLLGMMVTGAGAASTSFTDFDQIVNQEAAEVTSGLGIFDGYTDGSFGPENVVTRAEMAVIICKLLNGSDVDPGNFTGISKFNDVPAWAEGYVNYCASMGIVVGVGEGKFNPSATVSTVEAATMLLKALGYFTDEDKLQADWKTVVTGRATTLHLYGDLTLSVDEGLTRDNVAELVFHTLFAQRVAYDDNRHLYVKNTSRDVVVTNGTNDPLNTFAMNTFDMWYIDGIVTANSFTDDDLSETTNNAPRTEVLFNAEQDWDYMGGSSITHYPFEYTTGLDMIAHAARVYYSIDRNAPVVYAIADRATKVEYISYNSNATRLAEAANEAGFRRNTINQISSDDYLVNYDWDVTVKDLRAVTTNEVNLAGPDVNKTLIVISNQTDNTVNYVIVLDQYLDTVKRVAEKNGVTEYDLTTIDADDQNIAHEAFSEGDYVVVTDIGKQGDMFNLTAPELVSASISKITGVSDGQGTVKSIIADGTTYNGSPVADHRNNRYSDVGDALDDTTNFERITTLGEATLILDFQGKCIGLAEPETINDYAYAAQFGVRHITNTGLNTKFQLTVELHFQDGTSGVYVVNTSDNSTINAYNNYENVKGYASDEGKARAAADFLNGNANGHKYDPYRVYSNDAYNESGLGVYRVILRGDESAVLVKLGDDVAANANDGTRLVQSHSTIVLKNGDNLKDNSATPQPVYQTNKTVYFYVAGRWDDSTLSVGARTGIANVKGFTHVAPPNVGKYNGSTIVKVNDTDDNGENDSFIQILLNAIPSTGVYGNNRRTVQAVMVYGIDLGGDTDLYFYKEGNYHIEHKDSVSSKAVENDRIITYDLYKADGEMISKTYDNDGKYYDSVTAASTVSNKETGWYKIGSKDIQKEYTLGDRTAVDVVKYNPKTITVFPNPDIKNVYILNAETYHDEFQENIYTTVDKVGGIILTNAKVIDTVDCGLDSVSDIARACAAGHRVRISYTYKTNGTGAYEVKTIFVTAYNPNEGIKVNTGSGKNLVVTYTGDGYLYIYARNDYAPTPAVVAEAVKNELERYGFKNVKATVKNVITSGGNEITWEVQGDLNGVTYVFNGVSNEVRHTAEVVVNNKVSYIYVDGNAMTAARLGLAGNTYYTLRINKTDVNGSNADVVGTVYVSADTDATKRTVTVYNTDGSVSDKTLTDLIQKGYVVIFTTTNAKPAEPIKNLEGDVDEALTGVTATFDGNKEGEKFDANVGDTINVVITGAPDSRAVGDTATKFVVGTSYSVTINGVNKTVKCSEANKLTVPYTIQESDKTGLVIKVTAIVEASESDPNKTDITSIAVSFAPTSVKAGEAMPAITIGDVVPADAKSAVSAKWVKADGTDAGATAAAGEYKIQLSVTGDKYQIVDATKITGTTTLKVEEGETSGYWYATYNNATGDATATIYAYRGGTADGAVEPTAANIKAALEAGGRTINGSVVKGENGTWTARDNERNTITVTAAPSAGSPENPNPLYKVTIKYGADSTKTAYIDGTASVTALKDVTGLTGVNYLIPSDLLNAAIVAAANPATNKTLTVTSGKVTLPSGIVKDTTYVEALKVATTGDQTAISAFVGVLYVDGVLKKSLTVDNTGVGVQKGITLEFTPLATGPKTNTGITVKVNGSSAAKMNADANGELTGTTTLKLDGTYVNNEVSLTGETVAVQKEYTVTLNDEPQTLTKAEDGTQYVDLTGLQNTIIVKQQSDGTYAPATNATTTSGTVRYTAVNSDVCTTGGTEIKLYTAYSVVAPAASSWKFYENFNDLADTNTPLTADTAHYILAKPGEVKTLDVEASEGYKLLTVNPAKDTTHKAELAIKCASTTVAGVWTLKFQGNVPADMFTELAIFTAAGAKVDLDATVGTTAPATGTAVTSIANVPTTGYTATAAVKNDAGVTETLTVTPSIESDGSMTVKVSASKEIAQPESNGNDKTLGTITITLKDANGKDVMICSGITLTLTKGN